MNVTIKLTSLKVYDNGDPSHETKGELYYRFTVNGKKLAEQPRSRPTKVNDGQTLEFNNEITVENVFKGVGAESIIFRGYVGDVDKGFNGKNEKDTFKIYLTGRNKWKAGTNHIYLRDGRLNVRLSYEVNVSNPDTNEINEIIIAPTRSASVVIVSFEEDDPFTNLIQNAHNNYVLAFEGYDRSIIISQFFNNGGETPSHVEHDNNITKANMLARIKQLADEGYYIDLFIHSHGACNSIKMASDQDIVPDDIASLATDTYANGSFPLRMVYQVNCNGSTLNDDWINVGAKVVCGATGVNFYPNFWNKFMRKWNSGERFDEAVLQSNTASSRTVMQHLIVLDAINRGYKSTMFKNVLGKNDQAEAYHKKIWFRESCDVYNSNLKGKENMNIASTMIIVGDNDMRKTDATFSW